MFGCPTFATRLSGFPTDRTSSVGRLWLGWDKQKSISRCLCLFPTLAILALALPSAAQTNLTDPEAQSLIRKVLQTELQSAKSLGQQNPQQYRLKKTSPRLSTTKLILETKDGNVARLIAWNDEPLTPEQQQAEQTRLDTLLNDPSAQRHRQDREEQDSQRAQKIMAALPNAFLYKFAGVVETPSGPDYRMTFEPNPRFDPPDLESNVLKAMSGELWIDVAQQRVTRLQGTRLHDVDYGWGILGKLDQGGTLLLQQADIGNPQTNHEWRTTKMVLVMNARIVFKTIKLDTTLELTQFTPIAKGLTYQQAIQQLKSTTP